MRAARCLTAPNAQSARLVFSVFPSMEAATIVVVCIDAQTSFFLEAWSFAMLVRLSTHGS